ncbi:MAG TPA: hypothetical protein VFI60_05395, partial [Candidatus Acidoferrum sp.]|nr:hypothetical protein [Candidatus Acidoferrum sp.]
MPVPRERQKPDGCHPKGWRYIEVLEDGDVPGREHRDTKARKSPLQGSHACKAGAVHLRYLERKRKPPSC